MRFYMIVGPLEGWWYGMLYYLSDPLNFSQL